MILYKKLMQFFSLLLIIIFGFCSCSQKESPTHFNVVEIAGREGGFIYRVKVPLYWIFQKDSLDKNLEDTTLPIGEFYIMEGPEKIRITIHNFPTNRIDERIPPSAQISRWKQQFQSLDSTSCHMKSQAFGGYAGLLLEASGLIQNIETSLLGWSLQLAAEHYRALNPARISPLLAPHYRQMRSDVTIKAVGPKNLMDKYHEDIISFARSFQLIDDIP